MNRHRPLRSWVREALATRQRHLAEIPAGSIQPGDVFELHASGEWTDVGATDGGVELSLPPGEHHAVILGVDIAEDRITTAYVLPDGTVLDIRSSPLVPPGTAIVYSPPQDLIGYQEDDAERAAFFESGRRAREFARYMNPDEPNICPIPPIPVDWTQFDMVEPLPGLPEVSAEHFEAAQRYLEQQIARSGVPSWTPDQVAEFEQQMALYAGISLPVGAMSEAEHQQIRAEIGLVVQTPSGPIEYEPPEDDPATWPNRSHP